MIPSLLRFADLEERGVVRNWVTLKHWIDHEGFPPGRMLGPNTRAWTEQEIAEWISTRPLPTSKNRVACTSPTVPEEKAISDPESP